MTELNAFRIETVTRGYDSMFEQMKEAVPTGSFYDLSAPLVNYTKEPVLFNLITDRLFTTVSIKVERAGDYFDGVDQANIVAETNVVTNNYTVSFAVTLGKGLNKIIATETSANGRVAYFEVIASTNTLLLETYGREFSRPIELVERQKRSIYSGFSTRLLDQVVNFADILPDVQSLKILSSKLLVRSNIHFPATEVGTKNLIESLTLNTPVLKPMRTFNPRVMGEEPLLRVNEISGGVEAHVWYPNKAFLRWLTFTRMANSMRDLYEIIEVRDNLVRVKYKGVVQIHRFNLDEAGANVLTSGNGCFSDIEASFNFFLNTNMNICAWSYPFDDFVKKEKAIGNARTSFDLGVPLDSGLEFDADPVDPFTDGWVGWSLTGRFDNETLSSQTSQHPLDSHVNVSNTNYNGDPCSYKGAYTQLLNSSNFAVDFHLGATTEGEMLDSYIQGAVEDLFLDIPDEVLVAGTPVISVAKYVDSNIQTVSGNSGNVLIQEVGGTSLTSVPVVDGYQAFQLTPTVAGDAVQWEFTDGVYTGISGSRKVLPGPVAGINISVIGDFNKSDSYPVEITAVDAFGNPVKDVGINNKVTINPEAPFSVDSATPEYVELEDGKAVFVLTMNSVGTGKIKFTIGNESTYSNTFTVFNV